MNKWVSFKKKWLFLILFMNNLPNTRDFSHGRFTIFIIGEISAFFILGTIRRATDYKKEPKETVPVVNTKEVSYEVMLDTPYGLQKVDYSFTEAEKLMLFDMMNEQYKKLTGNPLAA